MTSLIWANILILGGIALTAAVVLYLTAQKFAVETSPLVDEVDSILPQANCGACGKAGCRNFAEACVAADAETFKTLYCPVGGKPVMDKVAAVLSLTPAAKQPTVAVLRCNGSCQNAPVKYDYSGLRSCRIASMVSVGETGCPDGCLRFGDCVQACRFDALHIDPQTGIPVIDAAKCTSCGACVKICPRGLFEIRPIAGNQQVYVACRNRQKGAAARKNCSAACIACQKCSKINPAVKIENNLSYIPSDVSPQEYGTRLAESCPTKAIVYKQAVLTENAE